MEIEKLNKLIADTREAIKDLSAEEATVFVENILAKDHAAVPVFILGRTCKEVGGKKVVINITKSGYFVSFEAPRNGNLNLTNSRKHEND